MYRTRDSGASYTALSDGLPADHSHLVILRDAMISDDLDPVGVYFGTSTGQVFASADEGDTWVLAAMALGGDGVDDVIELAGVKIRFLYLPQAHSDTDLMIEIPERGVLFLGDNAMMGRFGQMRHGTFKGNIAALDLARERRS